jgi:hypothetical protein
MPQVTERVAVALAELIAHSTHYIDLHTGGIALDIWPMSGYVMRPTKSGG